MVPTSSACANHRKRVGVAPCLVCGRTLCSDCAVRTPVGVKCPACTHTSVPAGAGGSGRRRWVAPAAGGGALLLVALLAVVLTRGGADGSDGSSVEPGPDRARTVVAERSSEFVGAGGLRLGATVTLPAGDGRPVPGVLIVPGAASVNRDGVINEAGQTDPVYADLSQALARAGVASLRYERRGTVSKLPVGQSLSFDDLVADGRAALALLSERAEIGGAPLAVVGHDQGGWVAMRLAGAEPRVRNVVLVSINGRPLVESISAELLLRGGEQGPALATQFRSAVDEVLRTGNPPAQASLPAQFRDIFAPGQGQYLRQIFSIDPATEARGLPVPALLVRGGQDVSITAADADRLSAVLKPGSEAMIGTGAVHNLALAVSHAEQVHEGVTGSRRDADLLARLAGWVAGRLGA